MRKQLTDKEMVARYKKDAAFKLAYRQRPEIRARQAARSKAIYRKMRAAYLASLKK